MLSRGVGVDGVQVLSQSFSTIAFEFKERDAIAELGVAGDDPPFHAHGAFVKPERRGHASTDWKSRHQFDVTAAPAEVGSFHADGNVFANLTKLDLNLNGMARIAPAVGRCQSVVHEMLVKKSHVVGSGPVLDNCQNPANLSAHR